MKPVGYDRVLLLECQKVIGFALATLHVHD